MKVDGMKSVKMKKQSWNEYLRSKGVATWEESLDELKSI